MQALSRRTSLSLLLVAWVVAGIGVGGVWYGGSLGARASLASESSLRIDTASLARAEAGTPYSSTLTAAGGTGVAITWRISRGRLPPGLELAGMQGAAQLWQGEWHATGTNSLQECSGVAVSKSNPGISWMHEDSGSGPYFYAARQDGTLAHRYRMTGFDNEPSWTSQIDIDMEDISLGPGAPGGLEYLFIGDIGDNSQDRGLQETGLRIYRLVEPVVPADSNGTTDVKVEAFHFRYPSSTPEGNRFDAETLLVDWETGTPYVVTKRYALGSGHVFKLPMPLDPAWTSANPVTLLPVTREPLGAPILPTGGDASRDGQRVVLRTYFETAYEYYRPAGGSFDDIFRNGLTSTPRSFAIPAGSLYEAIGYSADGTALYTATEGRGTPIHRIAAQSAVTTTTISGTPAMAGVFTFSVEVRDSSGAVSTGQLKLIVGAGGQHGRLFVPFLSAF